MGQLSTRVKIGQDTAPEDVLRSNGSLKFGPRSNIFDLSGRHHSVRSRVSPWFKETGTLRLFVAEGVSEMLDDC